MSNCIFCKIVNDEIPCSKVYEDDKVLAFKDINPEAPVHILVVPKQHIQSVLDLDEKNKSVTVDIFDAINKIAKLSGIDEDGFRVVANTGINGGQTVGHLHYHILGGRSLQWPPG
ncbi:MAG: histidine triad nucleotide-binding protein [Clostridiales bacterium GWB2_37_7]|nr:MAG: histidine triad nucleotide-binding protein [Clostridiales bacterium GWB2_37_7]